MAVPSTYMITANHLPGILEAIQHAGVPPRFTQEFLRSLGYESSNDRAVIGVLKSLGFLDQSGVPTDQYRAYRNRAEAPYILATAIREAYSDLFLAHENAQTLPAERVKGILATRVDKGDAVLKKMAATFRALVASAKWDREDGTDAPPSTDEAVPDSSDEPVSATAAMAGVPRPTVTGPGAGPEFHYNIQIHLPVTKDIAVYNAIFKSLREHLL